MRKILIVLLLLVPVTVLGADSKWYTMNEEGGARKCVVAHGSPAEFITEIKQKGLSYTVKDDTKGANKKPDLVVVTVEDTVNANFFRSLQKCKIMAELLDYKDNAELNRYR